MAVTITKDGHQVFQSANVNTAAGPRVTGLPPGVYGVTGTVRDRNGDTRTVHSRLIEAG